MKTHDGGMDADGYSVIIQYRNGDWDWSNLFHTEDEAMEHGEHLVKTFSMVVRFVVLHDGPVGAIEFCERRNEEPR